MPPEVSLPDQISASGMAGVIMKIGDSLNGAHENANAPQLFFELTETVLILGKGYGAEKFANARSLKNWNESITWEEIDTLLKRPGGPVLTARSENALA
jgi:hypothetical protein